MELHSGDVILIETGNDFDQRNKFDNNFGFIKPVANSKPLRDKTMMDRIRQLMMLVAMISFIALVVFYDVVICSFFVVLMVIAN